MKARLLALLIGLAAGQAFGAGLQKGHTTELTHQSNEAPLGVTSGDQLNSVITNTGKTVDQPGHLFATWPTADALLHIRAPQTPAGDGSARSVAATSNLVPLSTTDTTINFQTGVLSPLSSVLTDGGTFAFPSTTTSQFRRMGIVLTKDGTYNTHFSAQAASVGALDNPGTVLASLQGIPLGWVDLQATASTAFKTAGSSTAVIQDAVSGTPTVVSFGSGGGGGSGSGSSTVLWHQVDGGAPLYAEEFSEQTYQFSSGLTQQLRGTLKVPASYVAGNPIKVKLAEYSPDTSGTVLLTCTTNLVRAATPDAVSSSTNQRVSTNTAVTLASPANAYHEVTCDVTNTTGTINSVAVSPSDILAIYVSRGSDTATSDLRMIPSSTEVTFQ